MRFEFPATVAVYREDGDVKAAHKEAVELAEAIAHGDGSALYIQSDKPVSVEDD